MKGTKNAVIWRKRFPWKHETEGKMVKIGARKTKRVSKKGYEGKAMETRSRSVTNVIESPLGKPWFVLSTRNRQTARKYWQKPWKKLIIYVSLLGLQKLETFF